MILLDTHVVSEAVKPAPAPSVRAWLDAQAAETLFLSSVTVAELMFGIGALPKGRRKDKLTAALDGVLELFTNRILPFDTGAALCGTRRQGAGRRRGLPDARRLHRRHRRRPRFRGRFPRRERLHGGGLDRDRTLDGRRLSECRG